MEKPQEFGYPSDADREYGQDKKKNTLEKQFLRLVTSNVADTFRADSG